MSDKNMCNFCGKIFKTKFSLKRHYRNLHPGMVYDMTEPKKYYNLLGDLKCSICQSSFNHNNDFSDHLFKVHDISLKSMQLIFQSDSEFNEWKKCIESKGNIFYVKPRGARLSSVGKVEYFQCHRSGNYKNKISNRQRELKIQGSSKIDAFCPSKIKAVYSNDGVVTVDYCETHVGHKLEPTHLKLSKNENIEVESEVASKKPFEIILDVMEASIGGDMDRHLESEKQNVVGEFPINSECLPHSDNAFSMEDWVAKEMAENKENCIILYKPKDLNMPEYPHLNEEDFMLGIMNEGQVQILEKYGSGGICVDSFHRTITYSYEMIVLLVLDDLGRGFPCAFYYSNRNDQAAIETFLTAVKGKVGIISAAIIFTDLEDNFYKSWESVMGICQERLFCTWDLQQAWKKRTNQIKDEGKRKEAFRKIFNLHNELSEAAFEVILPMILKDLCEDVETKDFGQFLVNNFLNNCKSWAQCYRKNFGVDTSVDLERLHCIFKHFYLKGKMLNRLDITVQAVNKYNYWQRFDQLITFENGELSNKLRDVRARHKRSLTLSIEDVVPSSTKTWNVFTPSTFQVHTVSLGDASCGCFLNCRFCKACIHKFNCTCVDACIKWNMCKHIHLVCRKLQSVESMEMDDNLKFDVVHEEIVRSDVITNFIFEEQNETEAVVIAVCPDNSSDSFNVESSKQEIGEHFFSLLNEVTSSDEIDVFRKTIKCLEAQLDNLKKEKVLSLVSTHENYLNV